MQKRDSLSGEGSNILFYREQKRKEKNMNCLMHINLLCAMCLRVDMPLTTEVTI